MEIDIYETQEVTIHRSEMSTKFIDELGLGDCVNDDDVEHVFRIKDSKLKIILARGENNEHST